MRLPTPFVAALLFGSGLSALVYQTAWQRMFRLFFGASTAASAAVLAIFLGGLGLGGAWLGRKAEKTERPLVFYGNLEVGVAISAAITPALAIGARELYLAMGGSAALGSLGATIVRLVLATIVIGPPVVLMGGTLPAAARAVESESDAARSRLATLYAINTIGAVTGALLGTFVLFELFGTRLALWGAVLLNLLVAMIARAAGRRADAVPVEDASGENDAAEQEGAPAVPSAFAYAAAGIVGFAFLALELVWYRMLSPILGGSTFTFGLILAVALAGIGIGGYIYSRRSAERPATLSLLALTVGLEALAVGYPVFLGDGIAAFAAMTRPMSSMGFGALVASWVLVTAIVILPASIVSGYQFPVLFALLGRGRRSVAKHVGFAYAYNTIGSIVGSSLAGFYLIPTLGAVATWRFVAITLAALALVTVALSLRWEGRRFAGTSLGAALATVLALSCVTAEGPTAFWRHQPIGAGRARISTKEINELKALKARVNADIEREFDGIESAVGLSSGAGYAFVINGKNDGAVVVDRGTQAMAALLPAMLHPEPKKVFVLGLGTGMTAGWVGRAPSVERVDVAELEAAIIEVARASAKANENVLEQTNQHLFIGDGREFLLTSPHHYDVVVSEPSNPYRAGIASLFTREFYEVVSERLAEGGLFGQWVQGYEIDARTVRIIISTLRTVFPHVQAWCTDASDFLLIASREPRTYDADALRRKVAREPYRSALLRTWLVQDVEGVLSHYIAPNALLEAIANDPFPGINTDDTNMLEFAFAKAAGLQGADAVLNVLTLSAKRGVSRAPIRGSVDWERVDALRRRAWNISGGVAPKLPAVSAKARALASAVEAGCTGRMHGVLPEWRRAGNPPARDYVEIHVLAHAMAEAGDDAVLGLASRLRKAGFVASAELAVARLHARAGRHADATGALERSFAHMRDVAMPLCTTTKDALRLAESEAARSPKLARRIAEALLAGPFAIRASDRQRIELAQRTAHASGDASLCVRSLGDQLERPWWTDPFLRLRADCTARAGHPLADAARADVSEFEAATAGTFTDGR